MEMKAPPKAIKTMLVFNSIINGLRRMKNIPWMPVYSGGDDWVQKTTAGGSLIQAHKNGDVKFYDHKEKKAYFVGPSGCYVLDDYKLPRKDRR